jgi:hypothetical protein
MPGSMPAIIEMNNFPNRPHQKTETAAVHNRNAVFLLSFLCDKVQMKGIFDFKLMFGQISLT